MILSTLLKTLLLPPAINILLILVGLLFWVRHRFLARASVWLGLLSLWALSTPIVGAYLHYDLEVPYLMDVPQQQSLLMESHAPDGVQAIVVLGAGRHYQAQEYGGDTLSHNALWRLRYGAVLAKRWNLPVIVSGGNVRSGEIIPEGVLGAHFLLGELGVDTVWVEGRSRNTWENAQFTHALLEEKGIRKVAVVTHAYHMRRSVYAFEQAGIAHIAMPTGFLSHQAASAWWGNWLPSVSGLQRSYLALHEYLGWFYYQIK
jgi:uncharacterized SAM-binding protein YcdF (DUF218 family)